MRRPEEVDNGTFDDHEIGRTYILNQAQELLKEYSTLDLGSMRRPRLMANLDDFILSHRQLRSNPTAENYQIKNVKHFFHNNGDVGGDGNGPITAKETDFVNQDGDLVALVPKTKTLLRRGLDKLETWRTFFAFSERPVG